ncbi:MAG: ABC transporter permease subunit [Oscillospiraceae bacterium]|jgi:putative aldouronate transport system permease protein|nr:ABC transporter permease subunit [Oscillospiraceae bacterium]
MTTASPTARRRFYRSSLMKRIYRSRMLYLMLALPLIQYAVFRYAPLMGLQVAFKNFNMFKGMWASPWVGTKVFQEIFTNPKFWLALKNTVILNALDLAFGFPMPIILAVFLYEMRSLTIKRISQTILYLPHFLSWIIIGGIVTQIFGSTGMANQVASKLLGRNANFLMNETNWTIVYVAVGIWQSAGWGTIIYLAAISAVNTDLYEASEVDGCGRWRRIIHVTLPCIMPTIVVMLILRLGQMVAIGFERPYVMANDMVLNVAEVISTFVYKMGLRNARYSFATAVGMFGSVVNMLFLLAANIGAKRLGEDGLW